jgi:hypothetical protein
MIGVDTDFLAEVRRDLRSGYNLHAIEGKNPNMWIPVRRENPMTEFGADKSYGDLDVLGWTTSAGIFYAVKCKRLRFARTVGEVGEQLREFRGEEMDRLAKHMRRCAWLRQHVDVLRRVSKTSWPKVTVVPLLVPSTLVPMQFVSGLPLDPNHIVAFNRLRDCLKGQSSP